jgi:hypothetical protein
MSKHSIASAFERVVCCYALARPAAAEFTGNTGATVGSADVATRGLDAGVTDRMQARHLQRDLLPTRERWTPTHSTVLGAFLCCALNSFDFVQEHPHVEAEPPSGATSVASKV